MASWGPFPARAGAPPSSPAVSGQCSTRYRVRHFGVDVAEPTERYSAARWAEAVTGWVEEARLAGLQPLVVGGTGFYLRALFDPLFEEPELDHDRRLRLQALFDESPMAIGFAREGVILDANPAFLRLFRHPSVAALRGRTLFELSAPSHREQMQRMVAMRGARRASSPAILLSRSARGRDRVSARHHNNAGALGRWAPDHWIHV